MDDPPPEKASVPNCAFTSPVTVPVTVVTSQPGLVKVNFYDFVGVERQTLIRPSFLYLFGFAPTGTSEITVTAPGYITAKFTAISTTASFRLPPSLAIPVGPAVINIATYINTPAGAVNAVDKIKLRFDSDLVQPQVTSSSYQTVSISRVTGTHGLSDFRVSIQGLAPGTATVRLVTPTGFVDSAPGTNECRVDVRQ